MADSSRALDRAFLVLNLHFVDLPLSGQTAHGLSVMRSEAWLIIAFEANWLEW